MGEFAKVVRWTAPGAIAVLMAIMVLASGRWLLWQFVGLPQSDGRSLVSFAPGLVALIVAVTVPVGFLIYQIYFCLHTNVEGLLFQFVHKDVGLEALHSLGAPDVAAVCDWQTYPRVGLFLRWPRPGYHLPFTATSTLWLRHAKTGAPLTYARKERRVALREYTRACEKNWLALETKINTHSPLDERASDRVFASLERLADIYHTLGASKIAIGVGWLVGLVWFVGSMTMSAPDRPSWGALIGLLLGLGIRGMASILMVVALHSNRRHCLRRRIAAMIDACRV